MANYFYTPQYRPPGFATVPDGYEVVAQGSAFRLPMRPDIPCSSTYRYGVLCYQRALTRQELEDYELRPASFAG